MQKCKFLNIGHKISCLHLLLLLSFATVNDYTDLPGYFYHISRYLNAFTGENIS